MKILSKKYNVEVGNLTVFLLFGESSSAHILNILCTVNVRDSEAEKKSGKER
jgi:hypothetical protein